MFKYNREFDLKELDTILINSKLVISDPCYEVTEDIYRHHFPDHFNCQYIVETIKKGKYNIYTSLDENNRIYKLGLLHSDYSDTSSKTTTDDYHYKFQTGNCHDNKYDFNYLVCNNDDANRDRFLMAPKINSFGVRFKGIGVDSSLISIGDIYAYANNNDLKSKIGSFCSEDTSSIYINKEYNYIGCIAGYGDGLYNLELIMEDFDKEEIIGIILYF